MQRANRKNAKRPQAQASRNGALNYCFCCGPDNAEGMHLKFGVQENDSVVRGAFRMPARYQGSRSIVHGGIVATLLDEAMAKFNRSDQIVAPTAELRVEFLRPVPVGKKIVVEARRTARQGRNYWREGIIQDAEGNLLARGKARFVKIGERRAVQTGRSRG